MTDNNLYSDLKVGSANPIRSCVSCKRKSDKKELLRFVSLFDNELVCDIRQKLQSRGVYLCADKKCIENAVKRNSFSRFLKKDVAKTDIEKLVKDTAKGFESYFYTLMELLCKSGKVKIGFSAVNDAFEKSNISLFILSDNAGSSIKEKVVFMSKSKNIDIITISENFFEKQASNQKLIAIEAVTDEAVANTLKKVWHNYRVFNMW